MKISYVICPYAIEEKLQVKHGVQVREAQQVLLNASHIRFAEKGHVKGENVYAAFGQSFGGRYLAVFFVYKPQEQTAVIISARDMSKRERKSYG